MFRKQQGIVLVTTMIFLFVLSLLVITEIENNRYEQQMMEHYKNKIIAFNDAEVVLRQIIDKIINKRFVQQSVLSKIKDTIKIEQRNDGTVNYLITVNANYHNAIVQLRSCFEVSTLQKNKTIVRRLYWQEL